MSVKILILTPEYRGSGGGIITLYQSLVPALRDLGADVRVIEGSGMHAVHDPSPHVKNGIRTEILSYGLMTRWHERFTAYSAAPGLRRHLAAAWAMWEQAGYGEGYDVVEACDFGLSFVPPVIEGRHALIVQCHGSLGQIAVHDPLTESQTEGLLVRMIERAVLQHAGAIETYGPENARFWEGETGHRVAVVRPPLKLRPAAAGPVSNAGLVVGRLQRWKGPHVLCAAIEALGASPLCVDWIGRDMPWDTGSRSSAAHLAETFPSAWGNAVRHLPPVSRDEVIRRQATALYNLVPSTWDVFNFTAAEGLASGRPTIVSSGAGASDLIEDGRNGFTFRADDPTSLAASLKNLLGQSPERLRAIGNAGRETVVREMDPIVVAHARLETYRDAIASAPPAAGPSDWLTDICRPAATAQSDFAYLNQLPLRALIGHVAGRIGTIARARSPFRIARS